METIGQDNSWILKAKMYNVITNQIKEQLDNCTFCSFLTNKDGLYIRTLLKNELGGKDEIMTELNGEPNYTVIEQVVSNIKKGLNGTTS